MPQQSELIGAPEAARILHVDRATVTRWVKRGVLASSTKLDGPNGALVFERSVVEQLAADRVRSAS